MTSSDDIAWAPTSNPDLFRVAAIWVNSNQTSPLDRSTMLSLLAHRLQALIEASDDPEGTVAEFVHQLHIGNLWPYDGTEDVRDAANLLVWSNPAIEDQLSNYGVLNRLSQWPLHEMPEVREFLDGELEDPYASLMAWADAVSRPTWHYMGDSEVVGGEKDGCTNGSDVGSRPVTSPNVGASSVVFTEEEYKKAKQRLLNRLKKTSAPTTMAAEQVATLTVSGSDFQSAVNELVRIVPTRTLKSAELALSNCDTNLVLRISGAEVAVPAQGSWPHTTIVSGKYLKILAKEPLLGAVLSLVHSAAHLEIRGGNSKLKLPARWEDISPARFELPLDACERDVLRLANHHPPAVLVSSGLMPRIEAAEATFQSTLDSAMRLFKDFRLSRSDLEAAIRELIMK